MDNQGNRLYLNVGNNNNDRFAGNDRAYPTTPSTFPQPVFSSNQAPSSSSGLGSSQQSQPYSTGYAPSGYFQQNQYPPQYPAQPLSNAYGQARSNTPGASNDPNTGLAHQFSHQNLGGAARASPYGSRGPSPSQRPRTAGASGQQPSYDYLNAPTPIQPAQAPVFEFQAAPERNPDKYGPNANNNQKKCSQLAADFFKDSVKRARERNQR